MSDTIRQQLEQIISESDESTRHIAFSMALDQQRRLLGAPWMRNPPLALRGRDSSGNEPFTGQVG